MRVTLTLLVLLVTIALGPVEARAQAGQESTLGMEQRRKTQVIRPLPAPGTVEQDTDQAIEELRSERRREGIMRENVPHIRPPFADPDVRGGIQSQNIQRALPRR